jgi:uncharacterized membrane protein
MKQYHLQTRRGAIAILTALLSVALVGMIAFCVDLGFVLTAKEELQRTADAAAMAACWEYAQNLSEGYDSADAALMARAVASEYVSLNDVNGKSMTIGLNTSNGSEGDIVFGYVENLGYGGTTLQTQNPDLYNAVRVRVSKSSAINGQVPYFFARIFGMLGQDLVAEATAGIVRDVKGFQTPADNSNLELLPFALDQETWNDLMAGNGSNSWKWDEATGQIVPGSDAELEINLYPQGTGSPGNRGTVDIGSNNNSTADISRQIVHGVSPNDLAYHGGNLTFDNNGELFLNGDTGISAGVKDELASIKGQPRIIPVFSTVQGPGNNAQYTIVKWFGVRIMDVKLTGPMCKKHVTIQAAPITAKGVVPGETSGTSDHVYSSVVLIK